MKNLILKTGIARHFLCALLIAMLFSSCTLSYKYCHCVAKNYVINKGYAIDTAWYNGFHTTILTKDGCFIIIDSGKWNYPYVKEMNVVRKYSN